MAIMAYVGVDVHDAEFSVCVLGARGDDPLLRKTIPNNRAVVKKCFVKLAAKYELRVAYEASSCGFVFYRWLKELDIDCMVAAPSLVPKKAGDRVKTDKRDALKLARCLRNEDLTAVRVPTEQEEADRAVIRLRQSICQEVVRSKNQILKFLSAHGLYFRGEEGKPKPKNWTQKHQLWLDGLTFAGSDAIVWDHLTESLKEKVKRLEKIDATIEEMAQSQRYKAVASLLQCLRGVRTLNAMVLATEIGDCSRFRSARELMSYMGMVPSEDSSGLRRSQGAITKTGNAHCRRVIVQAAWKYSYKPAVTPALAKRQKDQPADVVAHANKAQKRLNDKYRSLASRKDVRKAVVAVGRELTGFIWAIMTGNCGTSRADACQPN